MTSIRHQKRIAFNAHDGHRLTRRERRRLGLPETVRERERGELPFPAEPEAYVWFALKTVPQHERLAALDLRDAGYVVFNPTERVEIRGNRRVRHKRAERRRSILTSMVLFGVPGRIETRPYRVGQGVRDVLVADVPWFDIVGMERIIAPVGIGRMPVSIPVDNVLQLKSLDGVAADMRRWTPKKGYPAAVGYGVFAGILGRVIEMTEGQARLLIEGSGVFAGRHSEANVPETWLVEPSAVA